MDEVYKNTLRFMMDELIKYYAKEYADTEEGKKAIHDFLEGKKDEIISKVYTKSIFEEIEVLMTDVSWGYLSGYLDKISG